MKREPIESVLVLLAALMIFFTGILLLCEWKFNSEGQVFQVISGLLTGISGAFLMRIKPRGATGAVVGGDDNSTTVIAPSTPPEVK